MERILRTETPLFHGANKKYDTIRPGVDGLSWFAMDSRHARSYINSTVTKGLVNRLDPLYEWESLPQSISDHHRRRLSRANLWDMQGSASIVLGSELITSFNSNGDYSPAMPIGVLHEARPARALRLYDLEQTLGESDTTLPHHAMYELFNEAEAVGYDGVRISDHLQSHIWGNFGHSSVGIFKPDECLQITRYHNVRKFDAHNLYEWAGDDPLNKTSDIIILSGADDFKYLFQLSEFPLEHLIDTANAIHADAVLTVHSNTPIWCRAEPLERKAEQLKAITDITGIQFPEPQIWRGSSKAHHDDSIYVNYQAGSTPRM